MSRENRAQPFSWWRLGGIELVVLLIIAAVDYVMGAEAQVLNGYEILRRTIAVPFGITLPEVTGTYIFLQNAFGDYALVWAWGLYVLWGLVFAVPIYAVVRRFGFW